MIRILIFNMVTFCFILSVWLYLFLVFVGIGNIIYRFLGLKIRVAEQFLALFWVGWAFTIVFLQLWHLFLPVDWRSSAVISLIGISGFRFIRKDLFHWKFLTKPEKVFCVAMLIAGLWLAYRSSLGYWNYDSGLYHLNAVKWAASFPIVPGLGNLHGRLAFNSPYFLYVAMLDVGFWAHKSAYLANGILLLVFLGQIFISWGKIFLGADKLRIQDVFCGLLIFPIFLLENVINNVSSPSPDLSIIILTMLVMINILTLAESVEMKRQERLCRMFFIINMLVLGMIIKLTFFVFGVASLILVYFLAGQKLMAVARCRRVMMSMFIVFCAVIGLWVCRGVILSGYIAYAVPWGSFPVEWRLPQASVMNMAHWITGWARKPQIHHWREMLGNWHWVGGWMISAMTNPNNIVFPLFLAITGFLVMIYLKCFQRLASFRRILWFCIIPPVLALIFWFITAPDFRFGAIFAWILGISLMSFVICYVNKPRELLIVLVLSCLMWQNFIGISLSDLRNIGTLICLEKLPLIDAPQVRLNTYTTRSGLVMYVPAEGDQCWDALLPCSPYPHPALRLRNVKSMRDGFMVDQKKESDESVGINNKTFW
ncbi:MAG: hypothetical protein HQL19_04685 [Candidatus Omnitrophica bacterium]|nr:hypothetical protein [Candidatus Omnitrophota bacterium]